MFIDLHVMNLLFSSE